MFKFGSPFFNTKPSNFSIRGKLGHTTITVFSPGNFVRILGSMAGVGELVQIVQHQRNKGKKNEGERIANNRHITTRTAPHATERDNHYTTGTQSHPSICKLLTCNVYWHSESIYSFQK